MKITFINPILGGDYSALDIALTTLATLVNKRSHHKARILDFTFQRKKWRKKLYWHIKEYKPEIIGFSTNNLYMNFIIDIAKEVKRINNRIKIIVGGYEASLHPHSLLNLEPVDFLFVGDAEESLVEFLDKLEKEEDLSSIKGLWYYDKRNKLISNPGSFFTKLDSLPYLDWDLWEDLDKYFYFLGMLYQMGSRGCIYNCSFCQSKEIRESVAGSYYRRMSPKRFAEELAWDWKKYRKRGLKLIQLFDPIPTFDREWLREFTQEYKNLVDPAKSKYSIFSRVDNLDEEKIKMLAESGCNMVRIGIESGDEYIRNKVLNKGLTDKKIWEVIKLLKKYKVKVTAYYILGAPGEDKRTIEKTIEMAKKIEAERSAFFIFKPFTKDSQVLIKKYNGRIDQKKSKKIDNLTFGAILNNKELSAAEVERYQIRAYLYTLPKRIIRLIKKDKLYLWHLLIYLMKGKFYGLDTKYLLSYFHVYGYRNVYE